MKNKVFKSKFSTGLIVVLIGLLIVVFYVGRWSGKDQKQVPDSQELVSKKQIWTCAMHPEIRQDHPGKCPICGMDLIPLSEEEAEATQADLIMSKSALKLANVQTATVEKGHASKEIQLTGKVAFDPQYAFAQSTHISGRVEDMFVNNVGEYVKKGDKIAVIYSAELLSAQKELIRAYKNREAQPEIYQAVRRRLILWKIDDQQIDAIIENGEPFEQFPIYADHSGYMVQKNIDRGEHVEDGTDLFIISQLDNLWGIFDVYEKDVMFIKKGMPIDYSLIALPGQKFETKIDFVEPVLNPDTRTLSARILISNPDKRFKPEMFLNGIVHADLAGHKDKIIIPKSAVMWTGKNSIVYVKKEVNHQVGFEMRHVNLGPSLGDSFVVEEGLKEGEEIVVQGTFSVDAAAQLAGKPSMMSHPDANSELTAQTASNKEEQTISLKPLFDQYFKTKDALVEDDFETAKKHYLEMIKVSKEIDWSMFPKGIQNEKQKLEDDLTLSTKEINKTTSIKVLRKTFLVKISKFIIDLAGVYKPYQQVYVQHCPMVNKVGADWLSLQEEVRNPYYGASMIDCGEMTQTIKK